MEILIDSRGTFFKEQKIVGMVAFLYFFDAQMSEAKLSVIEHSQQGGNGRSSVNRVNARTVYITRDIRVFIFNTFSIEIGTCY